MPTSYTTENAAVPDQTTTWLVGGSRNTADYIGGCPYATSLVSWSDTHWSLLLCTLPCRRWACGWCGPRKIRRLGIRCHAAEPNRFFTLTTWTKAHATPRNAFLTGSRKFPDLIKLIRKEFGPIEYLRILEAHKNGFPHWHVLARGPYLPQAWLSQVWNNLHQSPIVDVRRPEQIKNTYAYVVKYLCKCKQIAWTERRIAFSRKFFKTEPPAPNEGWKLISKKRFKTLPEKILDQHFQGRTIAQITPTAFLIEFRAGDDENWTHNNTIEGKLIK